MMQGMWWLVGLAACGLFGGDAGPVAPPPQDVPAGSIARLEADGGMPVAFTKAWGGYPVAVRLGLDYPAFTALHGVSPKDMVFQLPRIDGGLTQLMAHAGACIRQEGGCPHEVVNTVIALVSGEESCASTLADLKGRYGEPTSHETLEGVGSEPARIARWTSDDVVVKHQHGVMGKLVLCSIAFERPEPTP